MGFGKSKAKQRLFEPQIKADKSKDKTNLKAKQKHSPRRHREHRVSQGKAVKAGFGL